MKKFVLFGALLTFLVPLVNFADLGDITLRFCNDMDTNPQGTKDIQIDLDQEQEKEICLAFSNNSDKAQSIQLAFVDGSITNDTEKKKACGNMGDKTNFGQFVNRTGGLINIPAQSTVTRITTIKFPQGNGGLIYGCATYQMANEGSGATNEGQMFQIVVRKANFIDIKLSGDVSIGFGLSEFVTPSNEKNRSFNNKILAQLLPENAGINLSIVAINTGSATQNATITGTITNVFGFSQDFVVTQKTLLGKTSLPISAVVSNLPRYGGRFTVTYKIVHAPELPFMTEDTDKTLLDPQTIEVSTPLFVIPRILLAIFGAIILLILILIFRRKKKNPSQGTSLLSPAATQNRITTPFISKRTKSRLGNSVTTPTGEKKTPKKITIEKKPAKAEIKKPIIKKKK